MKYLEDLHHTTNSPHTRTLQTEKNEEKSRPMANCSQWDAATWKKLSQISHWICHCHRWIEGISISLFFAATEHRREGSSGEEKRKKNDKRRRHQFSLPRSLRRFKIIFIQFSSDLYWIFLSNFSTCMCHVEVEREEVARKKVVHTLNTEWLESQIPIDWREISIKIR